MGEGARNILRNIRNTREAVRRHGADVLAVHVPEHVDVRSIRMAAGLSQAAFAARFGFTTAAVQNWEQGHRRPEGPARVLLRVIQHEPEAVRRALAQSP